MTKVPGKYNRYQRLVKVTMYYEVVKVYRFNFHNK